MGAKILIVDDSLFMRKIVKNILTRNGFNEIVEAGSGLKAIEAFQKDSPAPGAAGHHYARDGGN